MNWEDLRVFLEVARMASCSKASRILKINQSTVGRRISALEEALEIPLFFKSSKGFILNGDGAKVFQLAEEMERLALNIKQLGYGVANQPKGTVRVTTIEDLASWSIVPELPAFHKKWPGINIHILTSSRVLNLQRGEADIAIRLARPTEDGLYGKKLGSFGYGVYGTESYLESLGSERKIEDLEWITLENPGPNFPEKTWIEEKFPFAKTVLKCNQLKTQFAAVLAGLGVALLANPVAKRHAELKRLPIDTSGLRREIWIVIPDNLKHLNTIQIVVEFLSNVATRPALHD